MHRLRFPEKLLRMAVALLCVLMLWPQTAHAQETILVSGNADLYPIEFYDAENACYAGLLPELYNRIGAEHGYTITYLPYSENASQNRHVQNRQADIISAYLPGTINEDALYSSILFCTVDIGGESCDVRIGFSDVLPRQQAQVLEQALSEISASKQLILLSDYAGTKQVPCFRLTRSLMLAALIAAGLAAIFILMYILKKKRAKIRAKLLADSRYGVGNEEYYLRCMQTLVPKAMKSLYYVVCIGCETEKLEQRGTEIESTRLFYELAQIIKQNCKSGDYLSCLDNKVFALIVQCDNRVEATACCISMLQSLDTYLEKSSERYKGIFRAGVCPLAEYLDSSAETLLSNARIALGYAHEHDLLCVFATDRMIEERKQIDRLQHSISLALKNGEFEPYFQFIVDRSGQIVGAELLSRWQNIQEGTLSPAKYIDMMIQNGMIVAHDLHMFQCACEQLQEWKHIGRTDLMLSCNFTRHCIADRLLVDKLRRIAEQYDFPRENVIIEITENSLIRNREIAQKNVESITELGFRIALDDIGSGYSALMDLCTFPLSFVKIDAKLLLEAEERVNSKFLSGLIHLSHKLDLLVVCEGVETRSLADTALAAECDYMQGYLFSRVLPKSEAVKWVL